MTRALCRSALVALAVVAIACGAGLRGQGRPRGGRGLALPDLVPASFDQLVSLRLSALRSSPYSGVVETWLMQALGVDRARAPELREALERVDRLVVAWPNEGRAEERQAVALLRGRFRRGELLSLSRRWCEVALTGSTPLASCERVRLRRRGGRRVLDLGTAAAAELDRGTWVVGTMRGVWATVERAAGRRAGTSFARSELAAVADSLGLDEAEAMSLIRMTPATRAEAYAGLPPEALRRVVDLLETIELMGISVEPTDDGLVVRTAVARQPGEVWTASREAAQTFAVGMMTAIGLPRLAGAAETSVDGNVVSATVELDEEQGWEALGDLRATIAGSFQPAPVAFTAEPVVLAPLTAPPEPSQTVLAFYRVETGGGYYFLGVVDGERGGELHVRFLDGEEAWLTLRDLRADTIRVGSSVAVFTPRGEWVGARVEERDEAGFVVTTAEGQLVVPAARVRVPAAHEP